MSKVFFSLASGNFLQDWSNSSLITANNNWDSVPSIVGYLGDDASTTTAGRDPQTITSDASLGAVNVIHDTAVTNTSGGVGEFSGLANPTIGLQGSGTADAPSIVLYLNSDGRDALHLDVDIRHLDADITTQQFNIQYRLGDTGAWSNLPGGYIADATAAANGGLTHLSIDLPDALSGQDQVELRFMTTNAPSSDEWLGVDNISVTSTAAAPDSTPPTLVSTIPATGSGHLTATDANLTLTFSEGVKAGAGSFSIIGDAGDVHTISAVDTTQVTFSGLAVTINPAADLNPLEHYHLAISDTAVTDRAGNAFAGSADAADFNTANPTPKIYDIQGASHTSPYQGLQVTTSGVVTAVDTTGAKGFWIQDPTGDGNHATSDAVFVFTGTTPTVTVGHLVQVSGTVDEFQGSSTNNLTITEINTDSAHITDEGVGPAIAPTVIGGAGGYNPPTEVIDSDHFANFNPDHDAVDFYESLEGMLVTLKDAQVVNATFSGETFVVPDEGLEATGMNSRGGITIGPGDMNPEAIELFNDSGVSGVNLNNVTGDHLGDVTGVVSYFGGNYEILPVSVGSTATAGQAIRETTTLTGDASHLTIGEYNLDNLDPSAGARFDALASDIVHNLGAPDIVGVEEIADDLAAVAAGSTDLSGTATLQKLVDAIAAAGGPHYAFAEIAPTVNGSNGGEPNGNIRQAFLYDPSKVTLVDGSLRQIQDDNLSDGDTYANSRHPLVADFQFNGETVTVVDVHNFARSGSDEDFGVDQPPINAGDQRRIDQTAPVEHFVQQQEAANPHAQIVVTGDFNGYQFETAQTQLTTGGILTNLDTLIDPTDRYSFSFDGNMEQIDHMFASPTLAANAQFDIVHLNTGQPGATHDTDHDPTLGRFLINAAPTAVADTASADDHQSVTIDVLANDTDPNPNDTHSVVSVSATTAGGHVAIQNGQVVYTADADTFDNLAVGQHATDAFTYVMQDSAGATSTATVTVTVNGIPAGPNQTGTSGDDSMTGTAGNETINGGAGNDTIDAGTGADTVAGGAGNDVLLGGAGADNLSGGDGNDTLTGGAGNDTLGGGRGADLFVFGHGFGHDVVGDYQAGADHIQFQDGAFTGFQDMVAHAAQSGANVLITDAAGDTLQLNNTTLATLNSHSGDFLFA